MDEHLQDYVYQIVGDEVSRKEYYPGPMARAVAEAQGNRDLIQSHYIRFRYEELYRQMERDLAENAAQEDMECPSCGFRGRPKRKSRGNFLILILLALFYIVPGIVYGFIFRGDKGVCSNCGKTLIGRLSKPNYACRIREATGNGHLKSVEIKP